MLYASFFRPRGIYGGWFNRAAAWVTGGPYCHCEFVFKWTPAQLADLTAKLQGHAPLRELEGDVYVCMYVLWGGTVNYRVLKEDSASEFFGVPRHKVQLELTDAQEQRVATWLLDEYGKSYDRVGALLCPFQWRAPKPTYPRYFCSQLMACALNAAGVTEIHNPGTMSPNALCRHVCIKQGVPLPNVHADLVS